MSEAQKIGRQGDDSMEFSDVNVKICRQSKSNPKVRWNGWLTEDNYDYIAKEAIHSERSMASILNRIISKLRRGEIVPRGEL